MNGKCLSNMVEMMDLTIMNFQVFLDSDLHTCLRTF